MTDVLKAEGMSKQMTLEQALAVLDDYFLHTSSQIAPKAYAVIRDNLNAAKGEAMNSQPECQIIQRSFMYVDGHHIPTLLIGFSENDWNSRDKFAASLKVLPFAVLVEK